MWCRFLHQKDAASTSGNVILSNLEKSVMEKMEACMPSGHKMRKFVTLHFTSLERIEAEIPLKKLKYPSTTSMWPYIEHL